MSRKNESITLSLSESDKEALETIAIEHNCLWGDKPNLSELNRKIAKRELALVSASISSDKASQLRGRRAIASIIKGLSELSLIWFGN